MTQQQKQWGAIIVMIAIFAMIAFVTNLCTPMATIIKNQGEISNTLAQIGNYGNFIAYLVMGIPAGMLISRFGYKKTALIGLVVGIIGILIQWYSGQIDTGDNLSVVFGVYLLGAFIAGMCMCILNCVVNPMLNILGGGGNKGNQYIQIGGVFNSTSAIACYILMGALIANASKAKISDATPALMIALTIFVIAFFVIMFTHIEEPGQAPVQVELIKGALGYRHFTLGALAIFLYMGIEIGVPNFVQQYLVNDRMMAPGIAGLIVAVYWFMMLVGRMIGASIGDKVSARTMLTGVSMLTLILVLFGMYAPQDYLVSFPGIDWGRLELIWAKIPVGIFSFLIIGLCTSVMWGSIFNMAVKGLGKYTAIASGIFMTMVFGCAVMMFIQALVADITDYITSFWVIVFCAAYLLFYALAGSRISNDR
ncbi:MAG: MFS transporter [Duncaniella sp.]|nr:MFS transporter [Duncaniella sp.]